MSSQFYSRRSPPRVFSGVLAWVLAGAIVMMLAFLAVASMAMGACATARRRRQDRAEHRNVPYKVERPEDEALQPIVFDLEISSGSRPDYGPRCQHTRRAKNADSPALRSLVSERRRLLFGERDSSLN